MLDQWHGADRRGKCKEKFWRAQYHLEKVMGHLLTAVWLQCNIMPKV